MKIKIVKPDGTTVEADGSAEECAAFCERIAGKPADAIPVCVPYVSWPRPWWESPFTYTVGTTTVSSGAISYNAAQTDADLGVDMTAAIERVKAWRAGEAS